MEFGNIAIMYHLYVRSSYIFVYNKINFEHFPFYKRKCYFKLHLLGELHFIDIKRLTYASIEIIVYITSQQVCLI